MDYFQSLYLRYVSEGMLNWKEIEAVSPKDTINIESLPHLDSKHYTELLNKIAVIKLNGGLAMKLGSTGPKSSIEVLQPSAVMSRLSVCVRIKMTSR